MSNFFKLRFTGVQKDKNGKDFSDTITIFVPAETDEEAKQSVIDTYQATNIEVIKDAEL